MAGASQQKPHPTGDPQRFARDAAETRQADLGVGDQSVATVLQQIEPFESGALNSRLISLTTARSPVRVEVRSVLEAIDRRELIHGLDLVPKRSNRCRDPAVQKCHVQGDGEAVVIADMEWAECCTGKASDNRSGTVLDALQGKVNFVCGLRPLERVEVGHDSSLADAHLLDGVRDLVVLPKHRLTLLGSDGERL
jgi:hypothetical protein